MAEADTLFPLDEVPEVPLLREPRRRATSARGVHLDARFLNERFWRKVDKDGPVPPHRPDLGPCWLWTASLNASGYGQFAVGSRSDGSKRPVRAHRLAYVVLVGPVPDGLTLDHLCHDSASCEGGAGCRHRRCVNPAHMEPVTRGDNVLRSALTIPAQNAAKVACVHGHEFSPENTYVTKAGVRQCRACKRKRERTAA